MLRDLQIAVAASLIDRSDQAEGRVKGGALSPARRLAIYRHNMMSNLAGALKDVFPVVKRVVGDAFFQHAAEQFIVATPSRSGDLNRFGREWPAFLGNYLHATELPYLADVARLEWAWHECFHAASAPSFDVCRLAAVPADVYGSLRVTLHPALRLVASAFPLLHIWQVNQLDYTGDMAINWHSEPETLLLRQENGAVVIEALPAAAFRFLAALDDGGTLEAATESALASDAAFDLQGFLLRCVQSELFVDISGMTHEGTY